MQDKRKPLSGAQRRKIRVANGGPRNLPSDIAAKKRWDKRREQRRRPERRAKGRAVRQAENTKFISALKVELGCADCGYNAHPAALDFDHLPGFSKTQIVSRMLQRTRTAILREIAKCECVCANCHRIRTFERKRAAQAADPPGPPDTTCEQLMLG